MSDPGLALVEAIGVERVFRGGQVRAVRGIDLQIRAPEVHLVTGPSGSGKSSLVYLLGALDRPTAGRVLFEGRDLAGLADRELALLRRRRIGFVFQAMNLLPGLKAVDNVMLGAMPEGVGAKERRRAVELLEAVGLGARVDHAPSELSGGEQQRVAVARALFNRPSLILADEPTGELDSQTGQVVVELLRRLAREWNAALVVVTHDLAILQPGDRHHRIRDGRLASDGAGGVAGVGAS